MTLQVKVFHLFICVVDVVMHKNVLIYKKIPQKVWEYLEIMTAGWSNMHTDVRAEMSRKLAS